MRNKSRFERGSGCYVCGCCGRRTRSTGRGDNEMVGLCAECFEVGGLENEISDYGDPEGKLAARINELNAICREKGGFASKEAV